METKQNTGIEPKDELLDLLALMHSPSPKCKTEKSLVGAASVEDIEGVKAFLAAGSTQKEREQALRYVILRDAPELIDLLFAAGPVNLGPVFISAAQSGKTELMRRLIAQKVDLNTYGDAALTAAAKNNQVAVAKLLLENGVPILRSKEPLIASASYKGSEVLKFFFANGVKPEDAGNALRAAAGELISFAEVKFLVDAGVNPKSHPHYFFDLQGQPIDPPLLPADVAEKQEQKEVAEFLRGNPIDEAALLAKQQKARDYWATPVDMAAIRKEMDEKKAHLLRGSARTEAVQKVVSMTGNAELKGKLNEKDKYGNTPLTLAASNGDVEIITALLAAGADINLPDGHGGSALYHAAHAGHTDIVSSLLKAGANPNSEEKPSHPPLIEAADWGDIAMVQILLEAGADPKAEDAGGRSSMLVAGGLNSRPIKALLTEAARKKAGDKWNKGKGLNFVGKKNLVDLATARGVQNFRKYYYKDNPEWAVGMVRGAIESVGQCYQQLAKATRWEKDIANRKISPAFRSVHLFQLRNSSWTIILWGLGTIGRQDPESLQLLAKEFSNALKTRAYTYLMEDTSGAEDYTLYENGEEKERASLADTEYFESKFRTKPKFDKEIFPDPIFADDGIYLPACYVENDGFEVKLVFQGLQKEDIARADMLALEE